MDFVYADLKRRFFAHVADMVISIGVMQAAALFWAKKWPITSADGFIKVYGYAFAVSVAFFVLAPQLLGTSLGKRIFGIRCLDNKQDAFLNRPRKIVREIFVYALSPLIGINLLLSGRRHMADWVGNTVVVQPRNPVSMFVAYPLYLIVFGAVMYLYFATYDKILELSPVTVAAREYLQKEKTVQYPARTVFVFFEARYGNVLFIDSAKKPWMIRTIYKNGVWLGIRPCTPVEVVESLANFVTNLGLVAYLEKNDGFKNLPPPFDQLAKSVMMIRHSADQLKKMKQEGADLSGMSEFANGLGEKIKDMNVTGDMVSALKGINPSDLERIQVLSPEEARQAVNQAVPSAQAVQEPEAALSKRDHLLLAHQYMELVAQHPDNLEYHQQACLHLEKFKKLADSNDVAVVKSYEDWLNAHRP